MMLRHHGGRHVEQHAIRVHKSDLLAMANKRHRLPLHQRDPNLVRQEAHHRGLLYPWNLFEFFAAIGDRDKKDIASDVFAEDWQQFSARHFGQAR